MTVAELFCADETETEDPIKVGGVPDEELEDDNEDDSSLDDDDDLEDE